MLERYVSLVAFLGEALGPRCEVVLHDLADPEHSLLEGSIAAVAQRLSVSEPTVYRYLTKCRRSSGAPPGGSEAPSVAASPSER
ncbi:PAS domain-containing protein [Mobilicoccus pelagius]|nr:PAS domain-containing protein [Mobilicoccus pelagius]